MYLGEDKVASLGSICNVSGSASKNLYDKDNLCIGYNVNSSTGELETNAVYNATNFIKVNGTITVSFSGKTGNYNKIFVGEYDENKNFITRQTNATTTSLQYQFTLNDNTKYIRFSHRNDAGITNVQIEKGSTATEYEKYFEPTISIKDSKGDYHEVPYMTGKVSKNLFNKNDVLKGYWINNGNIEVNTLWNVGGFFKVEPDTTYSYSSTLISGKSEIQTTIMYYDIDGNRITHSYFQTLTKTEKTPSNCYYARITYRNDVLENIQFEKGSTITSYEEYYEPTVSIRNSNGVFQDVELNKDNYSLGEQLVGTYLGKPFYKKTFIVNSPSQTSSSEIIVKLDSNCSIVKYEGFLETSAKARYQLNAWFSTTDYIYSFIPNLNEIKLRVSLSAYTSRPIEVTIWYTKG